MKRTIYTLTAILCSFIITGSAYAQGMAVNTSGAAAANSAMLDVTSTTKGMLIPRMTAANKTAISSPATGLLIYQTDGTAGFYYYNGSAWTAVGGGGSGTVTSVSSGNLSPIFTTSVSNATTTPAISYSLSGAPARTVLTNSVNATGAPVYGKVIPEALQNNGGTASSTTFYRGDGQWATPSGGGGSQVDLVVTKTSAQSLATGGPSVTPDDVIFNNVTTAPSLSGASYNSGTGVYTVGVTGNYMITANAMQTSSNIVSVTPQLVVNGTTVAYGVGAQSGNYNTGTFGRGMLTTVVSLTAGDVVKIKCANINTLNTMPLSTDGSTRFTIMKL